MSRVPFTPKERFDVLSRDNWTCQYCNARYPNAQLVIDHIEPVANGGSNAPDNLVTACFICNAGKAAGLLPDSVPKAFRLKRMVDTLPRIDGRLSWDREPTTRRIIQLLAGLSLLDAALTDTLDGPSQFTWETWACGMTHMIKHRTANLAAISLAALTSAPPPPHILRKLSIDLPDVEVK